MVMFHCYVSSPEGKPFKVVRYPLFFHDSFPCENHETHSEILAHWPMTWSWGDMRGMPLNPGWFIGIPRSWIIVIPNMYIYIYIIIIYVYIYILIYIYIMGSIIPYHQPTRLLNTAQVDFCHPKLWTSLDPSLRQRWSPTSSSWVRDVRKPKGFPTTFPLKNGENPHLWSFWFVFGQGN